MHTLGTPRLLPFCCLTLSHRFTVHASKTGRIERAMLDCVYIARMHTRACNCILKAPVCSENPLAFVYLRVIGCSVCPLRKSLQVTLKAAFRSHYRFAYRRAHKLRTSGRKKSVVTPQSDVHAPIQNMIYLRKSETGKFLEQQFEFLCLQVSFVLLTVFFLTNKLNCK